MSGSLPSDIGNRPIPVMAFNGTVHAISASGTTARNSSAIGDKIDVVTITSGTAFHFKQGDSSVEATTSDMRWPANVPLDLSTVVHKYVAVILASSTETIYVGERE